MRRIVIATDHGGWQLKEELLGWLELQGLPYVDVGAHSDESCDYPIIVQSFMRTFHADSDWGLLLCGSGFGVSIAANRFKKNRAIVARTTEDARLGRRHNNANILCLGARVTDFPLASEILDVFLQTEFESEERHVRRINQLDQL